MIYLVLALCTVIAVLLVTLHHVLYCMPVVQHPAPNPNTLLLTDDVVEAEYYVHKSINTYT